MPRKKGNNDVDVLAATLAGSNLSKDVDDDWSMGKQQKGKKKKPQKQQPAATDVTTTVVSEELNVQHDVDEPPKPPQSAGGKKKGGKKSRKEMVEDDEDDDIMAELRRDLEESIANELSADQPVSDHEEVTHEEVKTVDPIKDKKKKKKGKGEDLADFLCDLEADELKEPTVKNTASEGGKKGKNKKGRKSAVVKQIVVEEQEEIASTPPEDEEVVDEEVYYGSDREDESKEQRPAAEEEKTIKLSRKEMKKLEKERAKQKAEELEIEAAAGGSIEQFSVSQQEKSSRFNQLVTKNVNIDSFSISAKGRQLFTNANLKLVHGRRYGLVGPNGHGKTTLLNHIAKRALQIPENVDVLLCEQEVAADDTRAVDAVMKADEKRNVLLQLVEKLDKRTKGGDMAAIEEQNRAYEELNAMNSDAAEGKARRILTGLGFTTEMQNRATKHFSGGWRMRVSLARTLFIEPTLLMLDEPTNHLDLNAVIWLDNYLQVWKNTLLVVSHDQGFLDNVCTDIIHLDMQKLFYYECNYTQFKKMLKQKRRVQMKEWEKQEKRLIELKKQGKSSKQAEAKQKEALTRKQEKNRAKQNMIAGNEESAATQSQLLQKPKDYVVKFTFPNPPPLSPPILGLSDVIFGYSGQQLLFKNLNFGVDLNSRIAICGPNGVGKSTFIKLLVGELPPISGDLQKNHRLRLGRYDQHSAEQLEMHKSPVEYLSDRFNAKQQYCRQHLGKYGLSGSAHLIKCRDLSGGQKARVVLAALSWSEPDIIIMDEPTNNLDIESIDALAEAINKFKGGVVIVSHDERLIRDTNCTLHVVEHQNITKYDGDFDDYKTELLTMLGEEINNPSVAAQMALEISSDDDDFDN